MRAIGVSHTACKDEFRRILRSHSWSVFSFIYKNKHYQAGDIKGFLLAATVTFVPFEGL